jgi:hypothetical protein
MSFALASVLQMEISADALALLPAQGKGYRPLSELLMKQVVVCKSSGMNHLLNITRKCNGFITLQAGRNLRCRG